MQIHDTRPTLGAEKLEDSLSVIMCSLFQGNLVREGSRINRTDGPLQACMMSQCTPDKDLL